MTNNDSIQGRIVANVPFDLVSVIIYKITQRQIHTKLYEGSVTASSGGLEARIGVTVVCGEHGDENEDSSAGISSPTSASPCLEEGWITVSRRGVETIRFESRNSSGGKCLDFSLLEKRFSRNSEGPQCREEQQGGGWEPHIRTRKSDEGWAGRAALPAGALRAL